MLICKVQPSKAAGAAISDDFTTLRLGLFSDITTDMRGTNIGQTYRPQEYHKLILQILYNCP